MTDTSRDAASIPSSSAALMPQGGTATLANGWTVTVRPETPRPSRYAMSREHIKSYYGLSITRGMPVVFDGQPGRVTGLDGQYLLVRLDGQGPATPPLRCHPTWRMAYPTLVIDDTD